MGNSALGGVTVVEENKVKASTGDGTPDFLDGKVDGTTMTVVGNELVRAALTGDVTTVDNAATVVGGNADTVTTNANLTGDVTSVGNATTTVTNANLTGDVTSVGNATTTVTNANLTGDVTSVGNATTNVTNANLTGVVTSTGNATAIANKALGIAKLSDGTDGEMITWDSSGVIATVGAGSSGDVLTSNGAGSAPTMQAAAAGGGIVQNVQVFTSSGTWTKPGGISTVYIRIWKEAVAAEEMEVQILVVQVEVVEDILKGL